MPDFSEAKYASYRKLCHDLWDRLERDQFQPGDFYLRDGRVVLSVGRTASGDLKARLDTVWLPTLADWLEMLRILGARLITIEYLPSSPEDPEEIGISARGAVGLGPTEEEAAARLWLKVKAKEG